MDSTTIFAAVVILSAGLLFRYFDHLAAVRRANESEAAMIRVILGSVYFQRNPEDVCIKLRNRRRQVLGDRS